LTPPTPTPRPTSSSTSPCPPTLTTDSGAFQDASLVLGPRRPSAHGLGSSNHSSVLAPSRPFTLPSRRRESSPLASPEPAAYHAPRANRAVGLPCVGQGDEPGSLRREVTRGASEAGAESARRAPPPRQIATLRAPAVGDNLGDRPSSPRRLQSKPR
jgi:hypothetical protein